MREVVPRSGNGPGAAENLKIFDGSGKKLDSLLVTDATFTAGIFVA